MIIGLLGALINNENLGCLALTYSQIKLLEEISKEENLDIQYYVFEGHPSNEMTELLERKLGMEPGRIFAFDITPLFRLRRFLHHFRTGIQTWNAFRKCDLFIDLTAGDSFTDIYGQYTFDSETNVKLLVKKLGKPLVLGPQTYGPFQRKENIAKAVKAINRADVVISRDQRSAEYLAQFTDKEILVTTDLAFDLPYTKKEILATEKIRVGLNISGLLINHKTEATSLEIQFQTDYEQYIVNLLDWLLEAGIYQVYVIPHVGNDGTQWIKSQYGDRLTYLGPFQDPISAKNEIATMDIFIGSRMHATVGAFSSGVCTIPVAYSRKFSGLFHHLNYEYIINLLEMDTMQAVETTKAYIKDYKNLRTKVHAASGLIRKEYEKNRRIYRDILLSVGTPRE